jgi:hypothetical protein
MKLFRGLALILAILTPNAFALIQNPVEYLNEALGAKSYLAFRTRLRKVAAQKTTPAQNLSIRSLFLDEAAHLGYDLFFAWDVRVASGALPKGAMKVNENFAAADQECLKEISPPPRKPIASSKIL